jgi:hypothetical protein
MVVMVGVRRTRGQRLGVLRGLERLKMERLVLVLVLMLVLGLVLVLWLWGQRVLQQGLRLSQKRLLHKGLRGHHGLS